VSAAPDELVDAVRQAITAIGPKNWKRGNWLGLRLDALAQLERLRSVLTNLFKWDPWEFDLEQPPRDLVEFVRGHVDCQVRHFDQFGNVGNVLAGDAPVCGAAHPSQLVTCEFSKHHTGWHEAMVGNLRTQERYRWRDGEPRLGWSAVDGVVADAGGGEVRVAVDRDTQTYPAPGDRVEVRRGPEGT
jgi:hypothetical protein